MRQQFLGWVLMVGAVGCGGTDAPVTAPDASVESMVSGQGDASVSKPPAPALTKDAAMGPSPIPLVAPRNGTRLTMRVLRAEGGAEIFDSVYDPQEESACRWQRADLDPEWPYVCMPTRSLEGSLQYKDASCTEPVFVARTDQCAGRDLKLATYPQPADGGTTLATLGEALPDGTDLYYSLLDSCYPSDSTGAERTAQEYIPIPSDRLALGRRKAIPIPDSTYVWSVIEGNDGSITPEWIGLAENESCVFRPIDTDGTAICTSFQTPSAEAFGSAECMGVALDDIAEIEEGMPYGNIGIVNRDWSSPTCGNLVAAYKPGTRHEIVSVRVGDTCVRPAQTYLASGFGYTRGAPIPLDHYTPLTPVQVGEGRIKVVAYRTPGGALLLDDDLYDAELSTPCFPIQSPTGETVCAPSHLDVSGFMEFSDENCEFPAYRSSTCPRPGMRIFQMQYAPRDRCEPSQVKAITELFHDPGPVYRGQGPSDCEELTLRHRDQRLRAGASIDLKSLGTLTLEALNGSP